MKKFYRETEERVRKEIDVAQLVDTVIDLTRPRWEDMPAQKGHEIELSKQVESALPPIVGIETDLNEALTNLVFNACDAMPEGGNLSIEAHREDEAVVISVSDTGVGMTGEEKQRASEPFFTTKGEQGTGMGLGMVRGAMERHNGRLEIFSEKEQGSAVSLIFPLDQDAEETEDEGQRDSRELPKLTIICVDDDESSLQALVDILTEDDHEVLGYTSGGAALDEFERRVDSGLAVDTVITDLGMPGMDGREISRRVKELAPQMPVILITGGQSSADPSALAVDSVDGVIGKPPRIAQLRELLLREVDSTNSERKGAVE